MEKYMFLKRKGLISEFVLCVCVGQIKGQESTIRETISYGQLIPSSSISYFSSLLILLYIYLIKKNFFMFHEN
jgi:hypothetical protein